LCIELAQMPFDKLAACLYVACAAIIRVAVDPLCSLDPVAMNRRTRDRPFQSPRFRADARRVEEPPAESDHPDRLQKVLSAAGIGSRRHCEEMILQGRVEVDGQTVTELGVKVDPDRQKIFVDGEQLRRPRKVYYLVNKPEGVLSTNYDQAGRPRVLDLLPDIQGHLFTVGRLDQSSEGLILVTNDGELANRLTHPRYGVEKTYHALVAGDFTPGEAAVLTSGVRLAEGWAKAERVKIRSQRGKSTLLEIVLAEGRNREIRRLLARVGHKVLRLKRVGIASIRLADLAPGEFRRLRADELAALKQAARREGKARRKTDAPERVASDAAKGPDAAKRPHFGRGPQRVRRKGRRP
jgi:23S rRNA pseudouridine2605 synthase